ncbi:hypothetical protein GCM10027046_03930 [Uliginosibacterium flavum]
MRLFGQGLSGFEFLHGLEKGAHGAARMSDESADAAGISTGGGTMSSGDSAGGRGHLNSNRMHPVIP